jgi:hypothetical protein
MTQDELRDRLRLARTVVLFVAGLSGIIYETVVTGTERPTLLILFAAMIGLPLALRTDEKTRPPADKADVTGKRDNA